MKSLSPLQVLLFIVSCFFVLFAIDGFKRKRLNILHFLVFFGGSGLLLLFTLNARLLDVFGKYLGVSRGADILVYGSIIMLFYFFLGINNKIIKTEIRTTQTLRAIALQSTQGHISEKCTTIAIMPTYRQTKKVALLIQQLLSNNIGVIVIDDGYNENLPTFLIKEFANLNVVIISHPFNMGQGAALQTGQQYIINTLLHIEYVIHFDSDGQHQVKDIASFQQAFHNNPQFDIVLGSRFLIGSGRIPLYRSLHKKLQLLFTKAIIGISLTDTHNGFRMIRRSALPALEITLDDYTHASEIESLIKSHVLQYGEVPVHILYEEEHLSSGQSLWNAFRIAKNIIYQLFFFR